MQFDQGYLSPYFVTDAERMECVLDEPYILIYEKKISAMKDLLPLLEKVAKAKIRKLIPKKSYENSEFFWGCSRCKKIFWKGSHNTKILEKLRNLKTKPI